MPQDRHLDDPLGGVFRHGLKQASAASQGCPPADLLAAHFERSLTPAESSAWEAHFALCTVCQEQLAVMARIEGSVGVAAPVAAAPRFSFLNWRWLAPAFGAAGVLAIWVAVQPPAPAEIALNKQVHEVATAPVAEPAKGPATREGATAKAGSLVATPSTSAAKPNTDKLPEKVADALEKSAPANQVAATAAETTRAKVAAVAPAELAEFRASADEKKDQAKKEAAGLEAAARQSALQRADAAQGAKRSEEEKSREGLAEAQGRDKAQSQLATQARAPSATSPAAQQQQPASDPSLRGLTGALSSDARMRANESQRPATVGRAQEAPPKQEEDGARKMRTRDASSPAKPEFVAQAGRIQWRFFADGRIERYDERLKSGDVVASPVARELLAASAPSEKVCWAVGRGGTIVRAVNAEMWKVIGSPSDEDLVSVEARDEQTATVRSAGGKSYSTTDGGRTWRSL